MIEVIKGLTDRNHHEEARILVCKTYECARDLLPVYEALRELRDFFGCAVTGQSEIMYKADRVLEARLRGTLDDVHFARVWGSL